MGRVLEDLMAGRTDLAQFLAFPLRSCIEPQLAFMVNSWLKERRASVGAGRPLWDAIGASMCAYFDPRVAIRIPSLAPQRPSPDRAWISALVHSLTPADFGLSAGNALGLVSARAGLLQLNDFLDESHELSQSVEGEGNPRNGDYWHAIMHRREPDESNSKYWFRRVGEHPVFVPLAARAAERISKSDIEDAEAVRARLLPAGRWDPFAFVDFCCESRRLPGSPKESLALLLQLSEMLLLLECSCGPPPARSA